MLAMDAPDMDRRFGGLTRLYGASGAQKIRSAHVVVVGIGGVGSWAAEALARSSVARLTLIDLDHIAESNINRQIHALGSTVGQSKVQAMRERIEDINPDCEVRCVEEFVDAANWPTIAGLELNQQVSVLDACDQIRAKTAMAAWALERKVNFITLGAAGGKRHAHKVEIDDLALTTHDPLLAQLRYRLRKEHGASRQGKMGVSCVFSRESVMQPTTSSDTPQPDNNLSCHGYGSVVTVTATFGICAAGWLLDKIATDSFAKAPEITL
jgi:tRNA threonylcarbamoyladenosine dehydratase